MYVCCFCVFVDEIESEFNVLLEAEYRCYYVGNFRTK